MADATQFIASVIWLALGVLVYLRLKQWDKKFGELYEELRKAIEDDS